MLTISVGNLFHNAMVAGKKAKLVWINPCKGYSKFVIMASSNSWIVVDIVR